jgi:acetylornithine deacetylase
MMSANARQKVLQKIDDSREKAIRFLQEMIAIPSVTGDEGKVQKFLADYMAKLASTSICGKRIGKN